MEARADGSLHPYVVDFGLARDLNALDQTLSWAVLGTPAFMSPEQTRGEALGPATDIYSLGATLYALITGQPPYEGSTLAGLLTNQTDMGVRAVRRLDPKVPRDLETITLRCLEREPARRYDTAQALEADLRRFLAGEPIRARPVGPLGRLWRWARRKPALAGTAATGLLAASLLLAWNGHIRATSRLREQAAQRFGLEIRDAEHLLRIERMLPIHDIRPAEARLRARLQQIHAEMAQLGRTAQGPGHYALGRGHLALREFDKAIEELDGAWAGGFQSPEVAYGSGLARLKAYQRERTNQISKGNGDTNLEALRLRLVAPALQRMAQAKRASVDDMNLGLGLVAHAQGHFEEADRLFALALAEAPWLYEALVCRYENELAWHWMQPVEGSRLPGYYEHLMKRLGDLLRAAEQIAPSDDELLIQHANLFRGLAIMDSARTRRSEAPIKQAMHYMGEAARIRPDSEALRLDLAGATLQTGFIMLSSGKDPAPLMQQQAIKLATWSFREAWKEESDFLNMSGTIQHLWWVAAEADQRFGRSPWAALKEIRRWRSKRGIPDVHYAASLMLEAKALADVGRDPEPAFREAEGELLQIAQMHAEVFNTAFFHSIYGEVLWEWGRWLSMRHQGQALNTLLKAQDQLRQAARLDPTLAYTYYYLPRVHALKARLALKLDKNPKPGILAALDSAKRGLSINPNNAAIQLAVADAQLAVGEVQLAQGNSPNSAWAACRAALAAGMKVNSRDYRLALLEAELELALATSSGSPGVHLQAAAAACRAGLRLKGDEPRFQALLRAANGSPEAARAALTLE